MTIELIGIERLNESYKIYDDCRNDMTARNVLQWKPEYPSLEVVAEDIKNKELFGLINGQHCTGLIALNEQESPEYQTVNWQYTTGKFLVIHRLAVSPFQQKQGIATRLMDFAENFAATHNYTSIRLDTYSGNPTSVALYQSRHYVKRGEVYFKNRELPFFCLEKAIK